MYFLLKYAKGPSQEVSQNNLKKFKRTEIMQNVISNYNEANKKTQEADLKTTES